MTSTVRLHQTMLADHSAGTMNMLTGNLVEINDDGQLLVDYPGSGGTRVANLLSGSLNLFDKDEIKLPVMVLLAVPSMDISAPIILGRIDNKLSTPLIPSNEIELHLPVEDRQQINIDGKQVMLEAEEELILRCGKSSITLKKNGKVVIKGVDLLNRAERINKIKGASVNIN